MRVFAESKEDVITSSPGTSANRPSATYAPVDAFFSFFFFCFSLVESFGLLSFLPFSIPLAMVRASSRPRLLNPARKRKVYAQMRRSAKTSTPVTDT
jgi:hypothetical protein